MEYENDLEIHIFIHAKHGFGLTTHNKKRQMHILISNVHKRYLKTLLVFFICSCSESTKEKEVRWQKRSRVFCLVNKCYVYLVGIMAQVHEKMFHSIFNGVYGSTFMYMLQYYYIKVIPGLSRFLSESNSIHAIWSQCGDCFTIHVVAHISLFSNSSIHVVCLSVRIYFRLDFCTWKNASSL